MIHHNNSPNHNGCKNISCELVVDTDPYKLIKQACIIIRNNNISNDHSFCTQPCAVDIVKRLHTLSTDWFAHILLLLRSATATTVLSTVMCLGCSTVVPVPVVPTSITVELTSTCTYTRHLIWITSGFDVALERFSIVFYSDKKWSTEKPCSVLSLNSSIGSQSCRQMSKIYINIVVYVFSILEHIISFVI